MERLKIGLLVAVLVGACAISGLLFTGLSALRPAQAQSGQQWEYCAVSSSALLSVAGGRRLGTVWIIYFNESGEKVETLRENATERNGMAKAIAKLGSGGWELVGGAKLDVPVPAGEPLDALYFKRPKQQ